MKKLIILCFLFASLLSFGQWTRPNTSYGFRQYRIALDSTFLFPTGCGAPASLKAVDLHMAGLYFDSCGHVAFVYDPSTATWDTLGAGGGGGGGANNYPTSISFNTGSGVFTLNRNGLSAITANLDGRYLVISDTTGKWVDYMYNSAGENSDSLYQVKNTTATLVKVTDRKCGLVPGTGIVTWDSLLVFAVGPSIWYSCVDGTRYTATATNITLSAADPTNPRIDAIALQDGTGVVVVAGTPASSPAAPQLAANQTLLTYVQVNATATVPTGVTNTVIYDQNTEWTGSATGVSVNFANTTNPFHQTIAADVGAFTNGQSFKFVGPSQDLTTFSTLKFYIRLKASFANNAQLQLTWLNGSTQVSSVVPLVNNSFGFNRTLIGTYEEIQIPLSAWNLSSASANTLKITLAGTNASGFYFDYAQLQIGVTQPSQPPGIPLPQTLQQVFNTEPGGSLLTKDDSVNTQSHELFAMAASSGFVLHIKNTNGSGGGIFLDSSSLFSQKTNGNTAIYGKQTATANNATAIIGEATGNNPVQNAFVTGVKGIANDGYAFRGQVQNTGIPFFGYYSPVQNPTQLNTIHTMALFHRVGASDAANSSGMSIDFDSYYSHFNQQDTLARLIVLQTDTTTNNRSAEFRLDIQKDSVLINAMQVQTGGIVRVNNLSDTLATRAYARAFGGGGGSGGSGLNIYNSDSSLASDRSVNGNFKFLHITNLKDWHMKVGTGVNYMDDASDSTYRTITVNRGSEFGYLSLDPTTSNKFAQLAYGKSGASDYVTAYADSLVHNQTNGDYRFKNLPTGSSTDPIVTITSTGAIQKVISSTYQKAITKDDSLVHIVADSIFFKAFASVKNYGLVADNVVGSPSSGTNNTAALIAAIADCKSKGIHSLYFPPGRYRLSNSSSSGSLISNLRDFRLFGEDSKSVIVTDWTERVLRTDSNTVIEHLAFEGNGASGFPYQTAIYVTAVPCVLQNLWIKNIGGDYVSNGGGGILFTGTAPLTKEGIFVNNIFLDSNRCGLNFATRGEYIFCSNISGNTNYCGVGLSGGNVQITNSSFNAGTYGLYMQTGTNNGHGSIDNTNFNHNVYNRIADQQLGESFTNCNWYSGALIIERSRNIHFVNNQFDSMDSIRYDTDSSLYFTDCLIGQTAILTPIPITYVNSEKPNELFSKALNYQSPRFAMKQVSPSDSVEFNGIVKVKNIPTTSTALYGFVEDPSTPGLLKRELLSSANAKINELATKVIPTQDGSGAPVAGDSTYTYTPYIGKSTMFVFRNGDWQKSDTANGYQFNIATGKYTFHPPLDSNEYIAMYVIDSSRFQKDTLIPPSFDPDATTYFSAVATAGCTLTFGQKTAYSNWVTAEKAAGRYSTYTEVYPILGGTAACHAINAISPGSHNLTYTGTLTHDANGMKTSNSSSYADPGLTSLNFSQNNYNVAVYLNENINGGYDAGWYDGTDPLVEVSARISDLVLCYGMAATNDNYSNTDSRGYFMNTRSNSSNFLIVQNGTVTTKTRASATAVNSRPFLIGNLGNLSTSGSTRRIAMVVISTGTGLSSSAATSAYSAMLDLQTALGRQ